MPQKDNDTGELDQADVVLDVVFVTNHQAAEVVEPSEQPLDFPPALEATQGSTVLSFGFGSTAPTMRGDHFSAKTVEHFLVEPIAVIGLIANELLRNIDDKSLFQCLGHQFHFSRASALCAYGERKTMAVRNRHE